LSNNVKELLVTAGQGDLGGSLQPASFDVVSGSSSVSLVSDRSTETGLDVSEGIKRSYAAVSRSQGDCSYHRKLRRKLTEVKDLRLGDVETDKGISGDENSRGSDCETCSVRCDVAGIPSLTSKPVSVLLLEITETAEKPETTSRLVG
jgi:hypothetical protein